MNSENPAYPDGNRTICIDFDNTIHEAYNGYYNGTCYGPVIDGSRAALEILSSMFKIVILTVKAREDRPLINGKTGSELVEDWLKKNDLMQYVSEITAVKPPALYYIDDKGITYQNDWSEIVQIIIAELINPIKKRTIV
jgi:hypothetical protein